MLGSIYINRVRTKDLKQAILSQDQNDEMDIFIKNVRKLLCVYESRGLT